EVRGMVGHVVNSMMTHISFAAILERVMQDPSYCGGKFAQIKHLLQGMVSRYKYEETLYNCVLRIIAGEQLESLTAQKTQAAAPLTVYSTTCAICHHLYHPSSRALVHRCGHSYHPSCGGEGPVCVLCSGAGSQMQAATTQEKDKQTESLENIKTLDIQETDTQTSILDETQLEGIRRVGALYPGGSKLALLEDLAAPKGNSSSIANNSTTMGHMHLPMTAHSTTTTWPQQSSTSRQHSGSISGSQDPWLSENFALKLAPPNIELDFD
ncbi:unnamed protein product, partial [Meganyctiphanes norvegica]